MKKLILVFLFVILLAPQHFLETKEHHPRGLFVTVIQDPQVLSSRQEIIKLIEFSKKARVKTLFVQIYRANKSWFPSKIADQTPYEICFKSVSGDPLAFLVKEAHKAGIEVHAWLNMLSLSNNKNARLLKKYATEILTKNLKNKRKIEDFKIDNQYFLEPGDLRVRGELLNVVKEVLYAYPELDGVLFDYIRYPDKNPAYGYTKMNTERFKRETGNKVITEKSPDWQDWKRSQVTEFLKELVRVTKRVRPDIRISATGCVPFVRAYQEAYQDWPSWIKRHIVDSVLVMTYADNAPDFRKYTLEAKKEAAAAFNKVGVTVGAYKFLNSPEVFEEELKICEGSGSSACIILGYGDLVKSQKLRNSLVENQKISKLARR